MEEFKDQVSKFEIGQRVVSSGHGEVKIIGSGRENSYLVSKDGQEFEVYASTLTAAGEEEEEEEEEEEDEEV